MHAVALRSGEGGQVEDAGREDDLGDQQEGELGVLVPQSVEQAAANVTPERPIPANSARLWITPMPAPSR